MHSIVWKFTVRKEYIQEFIAGYGSNGEWANLFRRAEGYLGTQLLRSADEPDSFLTVDRWNTVDCFDSFQKQYSAEYKKLDAKFEAYTLSEEKVGVFVEV